MITELRCRVRSRARAEIPECPSQRCRNRANPAGSRVRARSRARAPLTAAAATSQLSEGRMRSAQIATFSAADNSARSHRDRRPWSLQPAQSAPAASQLRRPQRRWPASGPAMSRPAGLQPVEQPGQPADPFALGCRRSSRTNGGLVTCSRPPRGPAGGGPVRGHRPRRESVRAPIPAWLLERRRPRRPGRSPPDGHDAPFPNRTSRVSGR